MGSSAGRTECRLRAPRVPRRAAARICKWRREDTGGASPIRGVWNGLGVLPGGRARAEIALPAGRYRVRAALDLAPVGAAAHGLVTVRAGASRAVTELERLDGESRAGRTVPVELEVAHAGGALVLRLEARRPAPGNACGGDLQIDGRL